MKPMNQDAAPLRGSWTHSFEEDEAGVLVYRPSDSFAFPPARRGRETIEFGAGGALSIQVPGPDDRPRVQAGRWTALGMNRFALSGTAGERQRVIEVLEATPDILRIRNL